MSKEEFEIRLLEMFQSKIEEITNKTKIIIRASLGTVSVLLALFITGLVNYGGIKNKVENNTVSQNRNNALIQKYIDKYDSKGYINPAEHEALKKEVYILKGEYELWKELNK